MLTRRKNRRKLPREREPWLPDLNWRALFITSVSVAAIAAAATLVAWALNQPIESVAIAGTFQRVTPTEVDRAVKQSVRGQGLVSVNLDKVRAAVKTLPWVDTVSVERSFPHGLTVRIVEQVAAARWDETGLLNTRGELFASDAHHMPLELPQLAGPDGSETTVALRYLAMHGRLLESGMRLTALRLDARGAWEFDLDNGVTVRLGRKQVDERFETFMATAVKIVGQRATDIAYIDMRYANGFAIGWRAAAPHQEKSADESRDV